MFLSLNYTYFDVHRLLRYILRREWGKNRNNIYVMQICIQRNGYFMVSFSTLRSYFFSFVYYPNTNSILWIYWINRCRSCEWGSFIFAIEMFTHIKFQNHLTAEFVEFCYYFVQMIFIPYSFTWIVYALYV